MSTFSTEFRFRNLFDFNDLPQQLRESFHVLALSHPSDSVMPAPATPPLLSHMCWCCTQLARISTPFASNIHQLYCFQRTRHAVLRIGFPLTFLSHLRALSSFQPHLHHSPHSEHTRAFRQWRNTPARALQPRHTGRKRVVSTVWGSCSSVLLAGVKTSSSPIAPQPCRTPTSRTAPSSTLRLAACSTSVLPLQRISTITLLTTSKLQAEEVHGISANATANLRPSTLNCATASPCSHFQNSPEKFGSVRCLRVL